MSDTDSQASNPISGKASIHLLGALLLLFSSFDIYLMLAFWPVDAACSTCDPLSGVAARAWESAVSLFWLDQPVVMADEVRLLVIVVVCGALGSFIHALKSFAKHVGDGDFQANWLWWYLLRAPNGALLSLVFYFMVRGGFMMLSNGHKAADFEVFGIAAIATMAGLFTEQATSRLREVFDATFKTADGAKPV